MRQYSVNNTTMLPHLYFIPHIKGRQLKKRVRFESFSRKGLWFQEIEHYAVFCGRYKIKATHVPFNVYSSQPSLRMRSTAPQIVLTCRQISSTDTNCSDSFSGQIQTAPQVHWQPSKLKSFTSMLLILFDSPSWFPLAHDTNFRNINKNINADEKFERTASQEFRLLFYDQEITVDIRFHTIFWSTTLVSQIFWNHVWGLQSLPQLVNWKKKHENLEPRASLNHSRVTSFAPGGISSE